jgi:hypothetical protein
MANLNANGILLFAAKPARKPGLFSIPPDLNAAFCLYGMVCNRLV